MNSILKKGVALLALTSCIGMTGSAFAASGFDDVAEKDYFYPAVEWGVKAGITDGVDDGVFAPEGEVTRAQVVTFLWRMAGEPQAEATETFDDVEPGSWYEPAVRWAVANGITVGTDEGKFSPDVTCDRAMCMTLLYRLMGSQLDGIDFSEENVSSEELTLEGMTLEDFGVYLIKELVKTIRTADMFNDVAEGEYYELPVLWACMNGIITDGNTGTLEEGVKFRPADPCVRSEMISFLYQTKLMQDNMNAPALYDIGALTVPVPQEYTDKLAIDVYAVSDDGEPEGIEEMMVVSELASREAAEALGEDIEGVGELFRIARVSEDKMHEILCEDMSGVEIFAVDNAGLYYLFIHPTDVRYFRENNDKMAEDQDEWIELNEWASGICDDIIENSDYLYPVKYTNTNLDMALARIAYKGDKNYTISTTEFGPLEPGEVDAAPYATRLLHHCFEEVELDEAPDGEYVVLNLPEDGVRYDFFIADKYLVREVRDEYVTFYRCTDPAQIANTDTMLGWYDALAVQAGKKTADEALDVFSEL